MTIEKLKHLEEKIEQTKKEIFYKSECLEAVVQSLNARFIYISLLVISIMGVIAVVTSSVILLILTLITIFSCAVFFFLDVRDKVDRIFKLEFHISLLYKDLEIYKVKQNRIFRSLPTTIPVRRGQISQYRFIDDQLFWLLLISSHCEFDTEIPPSNPIVNMDTAIERSLDDATFTSLHEYKETPSSDTTETISNDTYSSSYDNSYNNSFSSSSSYSDSGGSSYSDSGGSSYSDS